MKYDDTSTFKKYELPKGFHYEFYNPGDELEWVNIHIESGEFTSVSQGLEWFHTFYDNFINELDKRCVFIVDDKTNEKVGTATVSLLKEKEHGYDAAIDWFAIKKRYQGMGLSKPLITKFMEIAKELGHKKVILHTQTTTWLAAKLYLDYGFGILNKDEVNGWRILRK
jgi:ribosomal protein S18 acetylase RimI-like enzyme